MASFLQIQKKKKLIESIEPLSTKYFINFIIWKLKFPKSYLKSNLNFNLHLIFWFRNNQKRSCKNLKKIGDKIANNLHDSFTVLCIIITLIRLNQALPESTGLSRFELFTQKIHIFKTYTHTQNWKTFFVADAPSLLRSFPLFYKYKTIDLRNQQHINLLFSPLHISQRSQYYIGSINLKNEIYNKNYYSYNFFKKLRINLHVRTNKPVSLDIIPNKLEVAFEHTQANDLFPLLNLKKSQDPMNLDSFISKSKKSITFNKKFNVAIIQKNSSQKIKQIIKTQSPKKAYWFSKRLINRNKKIKKYIRKVYVKNDILELYRDIFYKNKYETIRIINLPKYNFKKKRASNRILASLVSNYLNYFDFLKIIKNSNLKFFNPLLRPRLCSGYQFPDIKDIPKEYFSKSNHLKINTVLPGKYRSMFIKSFLKVIKKEKKIIKKLNQDSLSNFDKLYSTIEAPILRIPQTEQHQKRVTVYKKTNFAVKTIFGLKLNRIAEFYFPSSPQTLWFKHKDFCAISEPPSWYLITKLGLGILGFRIYTTFFKKQAREVLALGVDILGLAGLVEDAEFLKDELNLSYSVTKGYRGVRKVKRRLREVVGMKYFMRYLGDILWYLKCRKTRISYVLNLFKTIFTHNRSYLLQPTLLVGPPGTGKTLLVQAIAGESGVPVLLQSGGVLKDPRHSGKGARSIHNVFIRARQIIPCIIFIDELDGIGLRRESLAIKPEGDRDNITAVFDQYNEEAATFGDVENFMPAAPWYDDEEEDEKVINIDRETEFGETIPEARERQDNAVRIKVIQEIQVETRLRTEQIGALTQLLIELDGIHALKDIMVFAATNRPYVLDPALLRPGRFYRAIQLNLPDYRKRVDLLKLYLAPIGMETRVPWFYLAQRMEGLNGADISTIINESALIAIYENTRHTLQSLEKGFDRITTYGVMKDINAYNRKVFYTNLELRSRLFVNRFFMKNCQFRKKHLLRYQNFINLPTVKRFTYATNLKRLAYYETGQSIVRNILPRHPYSVYFSVQERPKNFRYKLRHSLVVSLMEELRSRVELEERLIGLLAGKASEFMYGYAALLPHLQNIDSRKKQPFNASTLGSEDIQSATLLAFLMVERWFLYSEKVCTHLHHPLIKGFTMQDYFPDSAKHFNAIFEEMELAVDTQNRFFMARRSNMQKWSFKTWWINHLIRDQYYYDSNTMRWYRLFLPIPEESERNIEWAPPDDYYAGIDIRKTSQSVFWHHFIKLLYDYLYHSLLMNCFNVSTSLLNQNRELLDYLVDFVLRHEKVRDNQIKRLTAHFIAPKKILTNFPIELRNLDEEEYITVNNWDNRLNAEKKRILNLKEIREIHIEEMVEEEPNEEENSEQPKLGFFRRLQIPEYLLKYPLIKDEDL